MLEADLKTAFAHHEAGRLDDAEAIYRRILKQEPHHSPALHLLGLIAHQRGDNKTAIRLIEQAIRISPTTATFHANLGIIRHAMQQMPAAEAALREALRLNPHDSQTLNNLGSALKNLGRGAEALDCFRRAIELQPDSLLPLLNLCAALAESGRLEDAEVAYRSALARAPNDGGVHFRYGLLLQQMGRLAQAAEHYCRTISLVPGAFEAHANLGNVLRELGQFEPAIASYREALRLRPDLAACHLNLASGLLTVGLVNEGLAESRLAIDIQPDLEEAHTTTLLALQYRVHPHVDVLAAHRRWAQVCCREAPAAARRVERRQAGSSSGRLRVALISPDFFDHPIAYFLEPLLAAHPREHWELTCYSAVVRPDAFTARLQGYVQHWRDIRGLAHDRVAAMIVEDRIDVLVDLAGHTSGNRLGVLALKPAPVQATYLGYPNTTGLNAVDFRLTDHFADPPGLTEGQYVEKLMRLPRTLACYLPPSAPEVGELPCRRTGRVTFASFSSLSKIAPQTIDQWARVLLAVEGARLVIMARGAEGTAFREQLRAAFFAAGIDWERIELHPSGPIERYLAFHNEVDVVLDTFPFNGHTTLCHALWMGVPVVSLAGDTYASRLGLSVLSNVGLPRLVAETPERFAAAAVELVHDLDRLATLRGGLRDQMSNSALMDWQQFAADFDQALRQMIAERA